MNIKFLADYPDVIPAVACLHQMEMRLGEHSNYYGTIERFRRRLNRESLPLTIVVVDTLPVGSASLVDCDLDSHRHLQPWLASLFVATPYHSQGIGRQLVQQIELIALLRGYQQLYLYTWTAQEYYTKLGWNVIDTAKPAERPESLVMQKIF